MRGYMLGERKLMRGERTGLLGSKRKAALEKYGYSYKNAVQMIRLAYSGSVFFETGFFPVSVINHEPFDLLMDIKTNPGKYKLPEIEAIVDEYEQKFVTSHDKSDVRFEFNRDVANEICHDVYMEKLSEPGKK